MKTTKTMKTMKTKTNNYTATLIDGIWHVGCENYTLSVGDESLSEEERATLEDGTSNDIRSFINNSGNF